MPAKDRHGKTAQDYRSALIAELDAVPDYRRRKPRHSPLLLIWLLVPVALLWLNWPWVQRWLHPAPMAEQPLDVSEAQAPTPPPSTALPAPEPRQALAAPQSLDTCLKQGNVVDEEVLRCRYGAVPRAQEPATASQGMVSAAYLAQYKADRELAPVRSSSSFSESHWVRKWDGSGSYLAAWDVQDNRIDYGSVCGNHRKGSIEYRECRKGAKQWFKVQCAALRKTRGQEVTSERYCSAAEGFGPMG